MFDYKVVDNKLYEILSHINGALPQERLEGVRTMINVGEEVLAFDTLCSNLYDFEAPISARAYELIDEVGQMMRLEEGDWKVLQPQVSVVA